MKKKLLLSVLATMAIGSLIGCGEQESKELEIKFGDIVPTAYVGEEYDFTYILEVEEGVTYSLDCYWHDYYKKEEHKLEVSDDLCFTPTEAFEILAECHAQKGEQTATRKINIPVSKRADPIDELLATGGYSGWADTGIRKDIETSESYLHGEESTTSIGIHYSGNNQYVWGCTVLCVNNFRCLDYWTDKTWENTILTFWVYNPTDYDLEFQLRINDVYTGLVNIDWTTFPSDRNIQQIAKPNEWTQVFFPIHKLGVDHTLFVNEEGTRNDSINIKVRWMGTPDADPCPLYTYQFYVDGVDFVPNTMYPDIDTTCKATAETAELGWENMPLDTSATKGYATANVSFNREFIRQSELKPQIKSKSSIELSFAGLKKYNDDYGFGVCFNLGSYFGEVTSRYPSFSHGVLTADIYFSDNITNHNVDLRVVQDGWSINTATTIEPVEMDDGWWRLSIDLGADGSFAKVTNATRFGFKFLGITAARQSKAVINIDNIFFDQNAGTPEPPELETISDGLENLALDTGYSGSRQKVSQDTCSRNPNSRYSLALDFNDATAQHYGNGLAGNGYGVAFSPEETSTQVDCSHGTFEFDIKFSSNITDHKVRLRLHKGWEDADAIAIDVEPVDGSLVDGWYHYSINLEAIDGISAFANPIRIVLAFFGVTSENASTAKVNIDNIFINA